MFRKENSEKDIKDLFRKLSKFLHPDVGGDGYLFEKLIMGRDSQLKLLIKANEIRKEREAEREAEAEAEEEEVYFKESNHPVDLSEEMPNELIEIMVSYSKEHEKFDPSFLLKMKDVYDEKGEITANQFNALLRVFRSFRMEEWHESVND